MNKGDSITLSEKHGLNPSLVRCFVCGELTNSIALMGRLKDDAEAESYRRNITRGERGSERRVIDICRSEETLIY